MSRDYSDYWSSLKGSHGSHPGNLFRYELIAEELSRARLQPETVIDCGCGDGSLLSVVSSAIQCGQLYGFDIADSVPSGLREAVHFQQQDLGAPVPAAMEGQFDLVLCSEVIEHVQDDDTVLANLFALAKPGGMVVLTTQTGTIYKTEQFLGHLRHYPFDQLRQRVEATGLKVAKAFRCGWPWLNMQKVAAHVMQDTVQTRIVQAEHLGTGVRMLFGVLRRLYRFSSRSNGPQLFILAQKPLAPATAGGRSSAEVSRAFGH